MSATGTRVGTGLRDLRRLVINSFHFRVVTSVTWELCFHARPFVRLLTHPYILAFFQCYYRLFNATVHEADIKQLLHAPQSFNLAK